MVKILFVCTGNICRSPIAEGILREKFKKIKIHALVDSCGFEAFHVGDAPDARAVFVARKYGTDISTHRARLFTVKDFDESDFIYVMDSSHYRQTMALARNDSDKSKTDYTLNILYPGQNQGVQDPWYHDTDAFEKVYRQLDQACEAIAQKIMNGSNQK